MFAVEVYAAVRRFVFVEGRSRREAARVFGLSRDTIGKMCRFSVPPGYVRSKPPEKPKLGALIPVIDAILEADKTAPAKQRHTAKRIYERLRDEHGFSGGYTVVKDHVRITRTRNREIFVPLSHPPGHAQMDFGESVGVIRRVARMKLHVFCFDLPRTRMPASSRLTPRRRRRHSWTATSQPSRSSGAFRCRSCMTISRSPWLVHPWGRWQADTHAGLFTGTAEPLPCFDDRFGRSAGQGEMAQG